jgi:ubiquinone biosynthesis monooxygenase Coq7
MRKMRNYSLSDRICQRIDGAIRAIHGTNQVANRPYPAINISEPILTKDESQVSAGLMRVNHTGEVCAQALYHAQALVAKDHAIQSQMTAAALEEGDHLAWCSQRLSELNSHVSYLNLVWYSGSFLIGMVAGISGDRWSLGFVAETEKQVGAHLGKHLQLLPKDDSKSALVLQQMQIDEAQHQQTAVDAGAAVLPHSITMLMNLVSRIMVKTSYYI